MDDLSDAKPIVDTFMLWGGMIGGITGLIFHLFYPIALCTLCGLSINVAIGVLLGRLNASGYLRVIDHFAGADAAQLERSIRMTAITITFPISLGLYFLTLLPYGLGLSHPLLTIFFWAALLAAAATGIAVWGCRCMVLYPTKRL